MFLAYAFFLNKFAILNASPPQMTTIPITIIIIADPLIMKHLGPSILFQAGQSLNVFVHSIFSDQ